MDELVAVAIEEVAYKAEQAMLPFAERDCFRCLGKGCVKCLQTGNLKRAHISFNRLGTSAYTETFRMWLFDICITCRGSGVLSYITNNPPCPCTKNDCVCSTCNELFQERHKL